MTSAPRGSEPETVWVAVGDTSAHYLTATAIARKLKELDTLIGTGARWTGASPEAEAEVLVLEAALSTDMWAYATSIGVAERIQKALRKSLTRPIRLVLRIRGSLDERLPWELCVVPPTEASARHHARRRKATSLPLGEQPGLALVRCPWESPGTRAGPVIATACVAGAAKPGTPESAMEEVTIRQQQAIAGNAKPLERIEPSDSVDLLYGLVHGRGANLVHLIGHGVARDPELNTGSAIDTWDPPAYALWDPERRAFEREPERFSA